MGNTLVDDLVEQTQKYARDQRLHVVESRRSLQGVVLSLKKGNWAVVKLFGRGETVMGVTIPAQPDNETNRPFIDQKDPYYTIRGLVDAGDYSGKWDYKDFFGTQGTISKNSVSTRKVYNR